MKLTNKRITLLGIGFIVFFLFFSALIAYLTSWNDPLSTSFKKLYPAAIVDSRIVSINEADEFVRVAKNMEPTANTSDIYSNFINRIKSEALIKKLGIKLQSDDLSDEMNFYLKGNEQEFASLIQTYFDDSESLFERTVVYPELIESKLQTYYNSNFDLNKNSYSKAQSIIDELNKGAKFEDLARAKSEDKASAQLGGDLGFFEHSQILPELEKEITIAKFGEFSKKIAVSRSGLHIIYPVETAVTDGKKLWHAKHILIKTSGFEQWLSSQIQGISVTSIKKY